MQDLCYAALMLLQRPGFTAVAALISVWTSARTRSNVVDAIGDNAVLEKEVRKSALFWLAIRSVSSPCSPASFSLDNPISNTTRLWNI
jgi:hypothetical protein